MSVFSSVSRLFTSVYEQQHFLLLPPFVAPCSVASVKTTLQKLSKIPNVAGLYRHENGTYYAKVKPRGAKYKKILTLDTTDRRLAEAKLADWKKQLAANVGGDITLAALCEKFLESKSNAKPKTIKNYNWVIGNFRKGFPKFNTSLMKINPLDYSTFIASLNYNPRSNNLHFEIMQMILELGVIGNYLTVNPLNKLKKTVRKKLKQHKSVIPTVEQAEQIIGAMISKGKDKRDSKDYLKFLFYAGIGEAELNNIRWGDIDFTEKRVHIYERVKTGKYFYVPFYPWLETFLVDLAARRKSKFGFVFKIKSIKQGIYNACARLKFPSYSPRCFRKSCIVRLIQQGMTPELIAKYQGHTDNGVLIRRVYANVITDSQSDYEKEQLARLS